MNWWKPSVEKKPAKTSSAELNRLQRLVEFNFHLHITSIPRKTEGMHVIETGALVTVDSGLDCDAFNILHITDSKRISRNSLKEIANYFQLHQRAFTIWVSDQQFVRGLDSVLHELSLFEANTEPGMLLNLTNYEPQENKLHENIIIADSAKHVLDYSMVLAGLSSPPDKNILSFYEQTSKPYLDSKNRIKLLVYYHEGIPISTMEMFLSDRSTIGLYNLATVAEFRGKGIGSAMMSFALKTAKSLGCENIVLQASQDGIGIYRKMGFEVVTNYHEFNRVRRKDAN
jgi:ribosomal protein S18 acetylase RimI-like enzyme